MQIKSFTYRKSFFGIYRKQGLLDLQKMDDHIAKMLNEGWEILSQTATSGDNIVLKPFSKRDTITVTYRKS